MRNKKYINLKAVMTTRFLSGTLQSAFFNIIEQYSLAVLARAGQKKELAIPFSESMKSELNTLFTSPLSYGVFIPVNLDGDKLTKTGGQTYLFQVVHGFLETFARREITAQVILAWDKLTGASASADFTGNTKSKTETNATGTSEQQASGTQAQKFASGLNTASAGTAVRNENTESTEGLTTGKTTTETEQGYAYDYAGHPKDFIEANAGRGIIAKIVDSLYASCIDEEDLYPWEIIEFEEIKA